MNFTTTNFNKIQLMLYLKDKQIDRAYYKTAAGTLELLFVDSLMYQAQFIDENYSDKNTAIFSENEITKLLLTGTPFQLKVWNALLQIPAGKITTYFDIAQMIGHPRSWRAVANAIGSNPIAYFIPCHRVLRKAGGLCGYNWGIDKKRALLQVEGVSLV